MLAKKNKSGLRIGFTLAIFAILLFGCVSPPATLIPPTAEPATLSPLTAAPPTAAPPTEVPPTETPTNTPTPEPARPTADPNLSPENNAAMVLENSVWVVKNADGKVTASWDSAAGKWTYDYENIQMQVGMVLPKFVMGLPDGISETGTVTVPPDMLKPLPPSQQDPNPLVPSGHYGDYIQTTQKGDVTEAELGVDYRGIIFIDHNGSDNFTPVDEYALVFTVQNNNHPDVLNVLVVPINNSRDEYLYADKSTSSGKLVLGTTYADFIAMLKAKNPVGRRMSLLVYVSTIPGTTNLDYTSDNQTMVDAVGAGVPIPSGLDVRLWAHDISILYDLADLSK